MPSAIILEPKKMEKQKRNSMIILLCISSLLLLNVLFALYNWGIFNHLHREQATFKMKFVKSKVVQLKPVLHEDVEPSSTTSTTTDQPKKFKKNGGIKITFHKMIRFVPKKMLRMENSSPFLPPPELFGSHQPEFQPLDINLGGPFGDLNGQMQSGPIPQGISKLLSKLMPNLDDIVRDLTGPHENGPPQFLQHNGELIDGGCLVCRMNGDQNEMKNRMEIDQQEDPVNQEPKITEVKSVLPESIFPGNPMETFENLQNPRKKTRHSLLIFMAPKKFGAGLGKMDPLPPFLPPPFFTGEKPLEELHESQLNQPIGEFSGVLPPSFPFHLIKNEGETPEKDLLSMLSEQINEHEEEEAKEEPKMNFEEFVPPPHIDLPLPLADGEHTITDNIQTFDPLIPLKEEEKEEKKEKKEAKVDSVPVFTPLDFSPKAVEADDIEKLATLEKVTKKMSFKATTKIPTLTNDNKSN